MHFAPLGLVAAMGVAVAHADGSSAAVSGALAGRGDRFIELRTTAGARYVNLAARKTISYEPGSIVVRLRDGAGAALRYEFAGGRASAPRGIDASGITYNFLVGERAKWVLGARSYGRIAYSSPWPGIDAHYAGDAAGIKYHFDVAPGAQPAAIRFRVSGADDARIAPDGAVEWTIAGTTVRDEAPVAFQSGPGGDTLVPASFTLERDEGAWMLGFKLGRYDAARALVVDPAWTAFSGLVGGNAADQVYAIARDAARNSIACGVTASPNLPVPGAFDATPNGGDTDAFIVKFNAAGAPQFVTYLGGAGFDACTAIALNPADSSIHVAGGTKSLDFPFAAAGDGNFRRTKATSDRDAFVARLPAAGNALLYSGVIGGTGDDQAHGIALDALGRAHVVGHTRSAAFPVLGSLQGALAGAMDGFALRIAASGAALEYSGFIGGAGDNDAARAIALAPDGTAYVVGETDSTAGLPGMAGTFRTAPGAGGSDGFVARISNTGAFVRFTVLTGIATGGFTGTDRALGVALDAGGVVVVGETDSTNFPASGAGAQLGTPFGGLRATPAGNMDGFALRLAPDLSAVHRYGYIGGTRFDAVQAAAANGSAAYFAGTSANPNAAGAGTSGLVPVATPGLRVLNLGLQDGIFGRLGADSATYLGFAGSATHDALHAIAIGDDSVAFLAGATGAGAAEMPSANTAALAPGGGAANGLVLRVNPFSGVATDLNGDGRSDVLYRNVATGQVYRLFANGLVLSGGAIAFTEPNTQWRVVADADFDGDGVTDLLWRHVSGPLWMMPFTASGFPAPGATVYSEPNPAWRIVQTPDLDGDGRADLVWWNSSTGQVYAVLMNGLSAGAQGFVYTEPNTDWRIVAAGDYAGSGKRNQLLWRNRITGQVFMMTVTFSGGVFSQTGALVYTEPDTAWKILGSADFNGDGRSDILWRRDGSGQVFVMTMNGASVSGGGQAWLEPDSAWTIAAFGDYNGDGRADLLWRHAGTGQVYMVLLNGAAIVGAGAVYGEPNLDWKVLGPYEYAQ